MKSVNMHDAKTHLSRYLADLAPGEALVLCNRNRPVAQLTALARTPLKPRLGVARGEFAVPGSFFKPLPKKILRAFYGE